MKTGSPASQYLSAWLDFIRLCKAAETRFGLWVKGPDSLIAEAVASTGVDYVAIDAQHGTFDLPAIAQIMQALQLHGCVAIVRVAANEPIGIMQALDAGAAGVIVPSVNTGAEAAQAVAACRYPTIGRRSYGSVRANVALGTRDRNVLDSALCFAMIETPEGAANVEDIVATSGLDGIYIGPVDLALGMGLGPERDQTNPAFLGSIGTIELACRREGLVLGTGCRTGQEARQRAASGYGMVTLGSDFDYLCHAVRVQLEVAQGQGSGGSRRADTSENV